MGHISFILAVDAQNYGVGLNSTMAWHIPEDLQFFKRKTIQKNLVMGTNTYNKLPHLPNRNLFILTSKQEILNQNNIEINQNKQIQPISESDLFHSSNNYILGGGANTLNIIIRNPLFLNKCKSGYITYISFKEEKQYDVYAKEFVEFIQNNFEIQYETVLANNEKYQAKVIKYNNKNYSDK